MERYETRIDDGTLFIETDEDDLEVGWEMSQHPCYATGTRKCGAVDPLDERLVGRFPDHR